MQCCCNLYLLQVVGRVGNLVHELKEEKEVYAYVYYRYRPVFPMKIWDYSLFQKVLFFQTDGINRSHFCFK